MNAVRPLALGASLVAILAGTLHAQAYRTLTAARMALGEDSLSVHVEFAAGTLRLVPGDGRTLYRTEAYYDETKFRSTSRYRPERGALEVAVVPRKGGFRIGRLETPQRLDLTLAPQVPLRLTIELGASEARLELGGLSLSAAQIKSGAAKVLVTFSRPNRIPCRRLELVAGVAEFRAEGLGNARCDEIVFRGGVGDVTLDFTGEWTEGAVRNAQIALGLGQLTLRLPRGLGVTIRVDRFLASFDHTGFTKRGSSQYISEGYDGAAAKLHLSVKAVLGDIDVEWVER